MSYFQNLVDQVIGEIEAQTPSLKRDLLPGDITYITCNNIKRYGIYLGNNQIIHCTAKGSEIVISSLSLFLENQTGFSILNFERLSRDLFGKESCSFYPSSKSPGGFEKKETSGHLFQLFSAEETIRRAKKYLNEQNGKLRINNCQNFVCWAKTGSLECKTLLLEKYWDVV